MFHLAKNIRLKAEKKHKIGNVDNAKFKVRDKLYGKVVMSTVMNRADTCDLIGPYFHFFLVRS